MTTSEFEQIKTKYNRLKEQASKAEGAKEQLLATLKNDYQLESIDEADEYLKNLLVQQKEIESSIANTTEELESITDWSKL